MDHFHWTISYFKPEPADRLERAHWGTKFAKHMAVRLGEVQMLLPLYRYCKCPTHLNEKFSSILSGRWERHCRGDANPTSLMSETGGKGWGRWGWEKVHVYSPCNLIISLLWDDRHPDGPAVSKSHLSSLDLRKWINRLCRLFSLCRLWAKRNQVHSSKRLHLITDMIHLDTYHVSNTQVTDMSSPDKKKLKKEKNKCMCQVLWNVPFIFTLV